MEDQTTVIETDRDELIRENEYLKAVLSNRTEIHDSKIDEENRSLSERAKELEEKNTELLDEINNLYEDRQTLISSLLNLKSEDVDDVIKRSRNSSLASRDSANDAERLRLLSEGVNEQVEAVLALSDENEEHEQCKKVIFLTLFVYDKLLRTRVKCNYFLTNTNSDLSFAHYTQVFASRSLVLGPLGLRSCLSNSYKVFFIHNLCQKGLEAKCNATCFF